MELSKGMKIKNRYEIVEFIGAGGFGATYKAIDHLLNRFVALKCSGRSLAHEAKIMKALHNVPNISHIYDDFVIGQQHFLVMELIRGKSLEAIRKAQGGTVGIQVVKQLLDSVIITLDQMHKSGIIHRDISPGNFLCGEDQRYYLIDFGSATSLTEAHLYNRQKFAHQGLDAPENDDISRQGPWTDIYSLCVTIVYLLSGEGIPAPEQRTLYDPVPGILTKLSLNAKMQNALFKGLSIEQKKRYGSAQEFANDFFGRAEASDKEVCRYAVHYHAKTDIGKRDVNQDNFMVDTLFNYAISDCEISGDIVCEPDIWHMVAVADGVAMANHGELAATATIQAVSHFVDYYRDAQGLHENMMKEFLDQLNEKIITLGRKIGRTASTISIMMWKNHEYCVANIGDSPVYCLRGSSLEKLSDIHTIAREKMNAGQCPTAQDLHTLSRYLGKQGIAGSEMAAIKTGKICPGDVFFVCSDGVIENIPEHKLKRYLQMAPDKAMVKMYTKAHKQTQMDNCTAIILRF